MKIRDLSTWESFYWVAKESNFSQAARILQIGPSLLSKRIQRLEAELGVRLFHRSTRKVSLTQDGQALLPKVQAFLEDAQGLEDQFESQEGLTGTIRLSCITALSHRVLAPLITRFIQLHPKVEFDFHPTDRWVDLIDEQMDLAIRVQEPSGADFVFRKLLLNQLVFCAAPSFLKSVEREIRNPQHLHAHPLLMLDVYENCRISGSKLKLGDFKSSQKVRCESGLFLTQLAMQGAGIAVRSIWDVHPLLESGALVRVLPRFKIEPFGQIYAVIPTRRLLAHRVRVFIDFLMAESLKWNYSN